MVRSINLRKYTLSAQCMSKFVAVKFQMPASNVTPQVSSSPSVNLFIEAASPRPELTLKLSVLQQCRMRRAFSFNSRKQCSESSPKDPSGGGPAASTNTVGCSAGGGCRGGRARLGEGAPLAKVGAEGEGWCATYRICESVGRGCLWGFRSTGCKTVILTPAHA